MKHWLAITALLVLAAGSFAQEVALTDEESAAVAAILAKAQQPDKPKEADQLTAPALPTEEPAEEPEEDEGIPVPRESASDRGYEVKDRDYNQRRFASEPIRGILNRRGAENRADQGARDGKAEH